MITSTPSNLSNLAKGSLAAKITAAQTTGITVTADAYTTASGTKYGQFPTGNSILKLTSTTQSNVTKVEFMGVESATQTGATVTLGTCIRDLDWEDGTDFTSQSNGLAFPAGTTVELVWTVQHAENTPFKNNANTFTGKQTFNAGVALGGTTAGLELTPLTTAEREALTPENGTIVYDETLGVNYQYVGGAWAAVGDTGTANSSETVSGKVEVGTSAQIDAETDTGETGAFIVARPSHIVSKNNLASTTAGKGSALVGHEGGTTVKAKLDVLTSAFGMILGDASDGTPDWSAGASLDPDTVFNYTTATLPVSQTLTVSEVNKVLRIYTQGDVTINGIVNLDGKGGAGGAGGPQGNANPPTGNDGSAGTNGASILTSSIVDGGNGGSKGDTSTSVWGGGASGGGGASIWTSGSAGVAGVDTGSGTSGTGGTAGAAMTTAHALLLSSINALIACGSGGGGGGSGGALTNAIDGMVTGAGGAGGNGGGALLWFIGGNLTLGADSEITADGTNGANGSSATGDTYRGPGAAGSGGGGGNVIIIVAGSITDGGLAVSATGGSGGTKGSTTQGTVAAADGVAGAAGNVYIYSITTGTLITN